MFAEKNNGVECKKPLTVHNLLAILKDKVFIKIQ